MRKLSRLTMVTTVLCALVGMSSVSIQAATPATGGDDLSAAITKDGSNGQKGVTPYKLAEAMQRLERLPAGYKMAIDVEVGPKGLTPNGITVTSTEGPVTLYATVYQQWYTTNDNYVSNAAVVIESLYQSNTVDRAINDHILLVPYIAQPAAGYTQKTPWATIHAVGNNGYKLLPSYLTGIGLSSDGLLNKTNSFANPSFYYTPSSGRGVTWGSSSNHRLSNTYATGLWNASFVDEFMSPGVASKFFLTDPAGYTLANLSDYILGSSDYSVTLKWVYYDGVNNPVSVAITLHSKIAASPILMNDMAYLPGRVVIGATGDTNSSWILQSTPQLRGPNGANSVWTDEGTMNSGDIFLRSTSPGMGFYRALLQ